MLQALPVVTDTPLWDAFLEVYQVPAYAVALELDIFESLDVEPASADELAKLRDFDPRSCRALLAMLKNSGALDLRCGQFQLSELGRRYLLKSSRFYWGHVFTRNGRTLQATQLLLETVNRDRERPDAIKLRPADGWESGHVEMEMARTVTNFMHSHSVAAAEGMTHTIDLSGITRLLDVAGGSGCFAISMVAKNPQMTATVMELPTICILAQERIQEAELSQRVDTVTVDMFREAWPEGYDAHFFSNVFHDWDFETCSQLAAASFASLPSGGTILLHEMLLDDCGTAPRHAVIFSLLMAMGTKGQQFTFGQLEKILKEAGFVSVKVQHSYGYYSVIMGIKP
jgi:predicted RNA-binding protein YlqC (UPF0109 family)